MCHSAEIMIMLRHEKKTKIQARANFSLYAQTLKLACLRIKDKARVRCSV